MREAHSANLKSRRHHILSAPIVAYSMGCPWVFTHPCIIPSSLTGNAMSPPRGRRLNIKQKKSLK